MRPITFCRGTNAEHFESSALFRADGQDPTEDALVPRSEATFQPASTPVCGLTRLL